MLFFGKKRKKKLNSRQKWDLQEKIYMLKWQGCNIIGKVKKSDCKESQAIKNIVFRLVSDDIYRIESFEEAKDFEHLFDSYDKIVSDNNAANY